MNETIDGTVETGKPWEAIGDGEYAIVELFGHTTLIGRIQEIERFGTKMLAIEPLFNGQLLQAVYHGGAAIYRLSPCSREVAWNRQHREAWQFPAAIRAIVPPQLLPVTVPEEAFSEEIDDNYGEG